MRRWFAPGLVLALALAIAGTYGCSDKNNNPTGTAQGTLRMSITDAPAAFDAVRLVVNEVAVHRAGSDTTGGWEVVRTDSATFDLIQLRNGTMAPLVTSTLAAGNFDMVRLKLGAGSTVVSNGVSYPLTVPSGMQSGFKIKGNFPVTAGNTTDLVLDFDADRSIVVTGNNTYILKPVVRVQVAATAGSISGRVLPDTASANVWASQATDTVGHALTASDGHFKMAALPAGMYTVTIRPVTGAYRDTSIVGVSVAANQDTNLGDITLMPTGGPAAPVSALRRRR